MCKRLKDNFRLTVKESIFGLILLIVLVAANSYNVYSNYQNLIYSETHPISTLTYTSIQSLPPLQFRVCKEFNYLTLAYDEIIQTWNSSELGFCFTYIQQANESFSARGASLPITYTEVMNSETNETEKVRNMDGSRFFSVDGQFSSVNNNLSVSVVGDNFTRANTISIPGDLYGAYVMLSITIEVDVSGKKKYYIVPSLQSAMYTSMDIFFFSVEESNLNFDNVLLITQTQSVTFFSCLSNIFLWLNLSWILISKLYPQVAVVKMVRVFMFGSIKRKLNSFEPKDSQKEGSEKDAKKKEGGIVGVNKKLPVLDIVAGKSKNDVAIEITSKDNPEAKKDDVVEIVAKNVELRPQRRGSSDSSSSEDVTQNSPDLSEEKPETPRGIDVIT